MYLFTIVLSWFCLEKRQRIVMRELEFDDRANIGGTELFAPVFLAVAEDNEDDTEFVGLRRKTQSIEDLCDLIEEEIGMGSLWY
jgi:hypothetical protein